MVVAAVEAVEIRRSSAAMERALERACFDYLEELRWPGGVTCPRCDSSRTGWIHTRTKWECHDCRYQFRVTAGTVFHNSHLPLWKWFAAVHLIVSSDQGCSARELQQRLGGSYKSFWFAGHRIRSGLAAADASADRAAPDPHRPELWRAIARAADRSLARPSRAGGTYAAGPYHRLEPAYAGYYAAERRWRERHRLAPRPYASAVHALLDGDPLELRRLVRPDDMGRGEAA